MDLAGQALTKDRGPAAVEIHGGETGREPGDATLSQGSTTDQGSPRTNCPPSDYAEVLGAHRARRNEPGTSMTGTAWQRLSDLDACRVTQIPRRPPAAAAAEAPGVTPAGTRAGRGVKSADDEDEDSKKKAAGKKGGSLSSRRRGVDGRAWRRRREDEPHELTVEAVFHR